MHGIHAMQTCKTYIHAVHIGSTHMPTYMQCMHAMRTCNAMQCTYAMHTGMHKRNAYIQRDTHISGYRPNVMLSTDPESSQLDLPFQMVFKGLIALD